jgi:hypothetical protein
VKTDEEIDGEPFCLTCTRPFLSGVRVRLLAKHEFGWFEQAHLPAGGGLAHHSKIPWFCNCES